MTKTIDPFANDFCDSEESKQDDVSYIIPNIETKLSKPKRDACRDIVQEIRKFGVNQRQLVYLIYLLSLELENNEAMRAISKAASTAKEFVPVNEIEEQPKILLDESRQPKKLIVE